MQVIRRKRNIAQPNLHLCHSLYLAYHSSFYHIYTLLLTLSLYFKLPVIFRVSSPSKHDFLTLLLYLSLFIIICSERCEVTVAKSLVDIGFHMHHVFLKNLRCCNVLASVYVYPSRVAYNQAYYSNYWSHMQFSHSC